MPVTHRVCPILPGLSIAESTGEYYFYTGSTQAQLKRFFEFSLTESELFGKNKFDIAKKYIPLDFDEMLLQGTMYMYNTWLVLNKIKGYNAV